MLSMKTSILLVLPVLLFGCRTSSPDAERAEATTAEPLPRILDNREVDAPQAPFPQPDWPPIWAIAGVTVDLGEVDRIDGVFLRVVHGQQDRSQLAEHYLAQLQAAGWKVTDVVEDEAFLRTDLVRQDLMLTALAQPLAEGAFVGLSLHQHWGSMELPLEGAAASLAEANSLRASFPTDRTVDAVYDELIAFLTGQRAWTEEVAEMVAAPPGVVQVRVSWLVKDRRILRLQVHALEDGSVHLTLEAGWR